MMTFKVIEYLFKVQNSNKNVAVWNQTFTFTKMKLFSILLVLFVISQVFGGYSRCLKKFSGIVCEDERDCGPYGSCQIVGLVSFGEYGE